MSCTRRSSTRVGSQTVFTALLLIALLPIASCERHEPYVDSGLRPNVVLIVLDTVRRDHLSLYGYERETAPNLAQIAKEGRTFDNAHSVSSWTIPSHASLFTGHYPVAHHATRESYVLDERLPVLAEILSEHGYETIAFVSNPMVLAKGGYARGFSAFREIWRERYLELKNEAAKGEERQKQTYALTLYEDRLNVKKVGEWLDSRDSEEPFFLFVNLNGAHAPYTSAGPYQAAFRSIAQITERERDLGRRAAANIHWVRRFYLGREPVSEDEFEFLADNYDGELRQVDHNLGRISSLLRERALLDDTVFIVTSDHGESHGEKGHLGHYFTLDPSLTEIPLVIRYPKAFEPGSHESRPTTIVDIFPTILELVGIDPASRPHQGVPLASRRPDAERAIFSEVRRPLDLVPRMREMAEGDEEEEARITALDRDLRAFSCGELRIIWASDGKHQLYEVTTDPDQTQNLIEDPKHQAAAARCLASLERFRSRHSIKRVAREKTPQGLPDLDEINLEALQAIGYLE